MDTSFVIVCLIVVGLVSIPYFLFGLAGQSEKKNMKAKINQIIEKNNLSVSQSENWGNTYIGLDTNHRKILFLKILASENLEQLLDLDIINGCQIMEKRKAIKINDKKELLLEKLDLEVTFKNNEHRFLNFYDRDQMIQEDLELQRIQKWKNILIDHLSKVPVTKKVA